MQEFIDYSLIFVFVFSILVVLKNLASFSLIMASEKGKMELSTFSLISLGFSISYIITILIYWI